MNNKRNAWPEGTTLDPEHIEHYFELFLGRKPKDETEARMLLHFSRLPKDPRFEVFRYLTQRPGFIDNSSDILHIILDLMLRMRVFNKKKPPKTNLFCVGAPRCGTTLLSKMLSEHSNIFIPQIKEPCFFSHFSKSATPNGVGLEFYDFYFIGHAGEKYLGDFTPTYLSSKAALDGIKDYNSDAKIIVCLRDPVDRAISAYFYTLPFHKRTDMASFFKAGIFGLAKDGADGKSWLAPETLIRHGLFASDISRVREHFTDVEIVAMDDLKDISAVYARLCAFLDIREEGIDHIIDVNRKINASAKADVVGEEEARAMLTDFYASDLDELERSHGIKLRADQ